MCGRFTLSADPGELAEYFQTPPVSWTPRYNVAPTQAVLACRLDAYNRKRELAHLHWGLIPSWADDPAIGNRMINARSVRARPITSIFGQKQMASACGSLEPTG